MEKTHNPTNTARLHMDGRVWWVIYIPRVVITQTDTHAEQPTFTNTQKTSVTTNLSNAVQSCDSVFYLNVLNIYLYLQDILEVADDCFSSHIWGVICLIHTGIHIGNGNIEPGTKFLLIHQFKVSKCQFPHHNFANVFFWRNSSTFWKILYLLAGHNRYKTC